MGYSRKLGINPIISIANIIFSQQFYYKKDPKNLNLKVAILPLKPHKMKAQTQISTGLDATYFALFLRFIRDGLVPVPCLQLGREVTNKFVGNQQPAEMFL